MAKASKEVVIPWVRLAGSSLFKPSAFDDSKEPDFNGRVLIEKKSKGLKIAMDAINEVYKEEFGEDFKPGAKKYPLHQSSDMEDKPGFDDTTVYLNFKSDMPPALADQDKNQVREVDGVIYPGCYGHLWVKFYAWGPSKFGKGVGCELKGFRFMKDGDRLGGSKPPVVDDFPDLDDEEAPGSDWDEPETKEEESSDDWM